MSVSFTDLEAVCARDEHRGCAYFEAACVESPDIYASLLNRGLSIYNEIDEHTSIRSVESGVYPFFANTYNLTSVILDINSIIIEDSLLEQVRPLVACEIQPAEMQRAFHVEHQATKRPVTKLRIPFDGYSSDVTLAALKAYEVDPPKRKWYHLNRKAMRDVPSYFADREVIQKYRSEPRVNWLSTGDARISKQFLAEQGILSVGTLFCSLPLFRVLAPHFRKGFVAAAYHEYQAP